MKNQFTNCPVGKDINQHFQIQLIQLGLDPKTEQDKQQLMQILNFYLNYPDDELANHHRNANRLGILDLTSDQRVKMADSQQLTDEFKSNIRETNILKVNSNTCKCCGFIVQENSINVCGTQLKNVTNLGTATNIFFRTFYNLVLLLLVLSVIYSFFAFASNVSVARSSNYMNSSNSTLDYLSISLGSKSKHNKASNIDGEMYYYISSWLGVLMLVFWWFMFACFKRKIANIENDDRRKLKVSDFSIVIENMPIDFTLYEIQRQFNLYLQKLKEQNENITLTQIKVVKYNQGKPFYFNQNQFTDQQLVQILEKYNQTKEKIALYVEEYMNSQKFITNLVQRRSTYSKLQQLSQRKQKKYEQIINKIKRLLNSTQGVSKTVVFVTFLTHQMRQFILQYNKNTIFHKLRRFVQCWKKSDYFSVIKDNQIFDNIKVQEPPQPEDINWGNLGVSYIQKFFRKSFTIFATILMIGICFIIVYGLSTVQNANQSTRFISFLISLAISITNLLIIKVIQYMTVIEKDYSMNNFQMSIAIKSVIAQVTNSIFVPLMTNHYIKKQNIFTQSGLVQDIFILGITSSLIPPIVRIIDPYNIFLILRYKYYHSENRKLRLNQFQLNEISQKMEFQIGMEYIFILTNYLFMCFFVSLQPILPLFAIIGIFLMYWFEKYALFNRCQRPVPGPDVITSTMYQLIFFGPVCFALGNLTWSYFMPDDSFRGSILPNLISAGLSVVTFIFPYDLFSPKLDYKQTKTYHQKRIYFPSQYDRLNPSTSRKGIEQYIVFLSEKKRELQMSANSEQNEQVLKELATVTQKNIYKGNIMNKLIQNEQDFIVEQIFKNQSRNVINPLFLLTSLNLNNNHQRQSWKQTKNHSAIPKLKFGLSMKEQPQPSSKVFLDSLNYEIPASQQHIFNNYGTNINIDEILRLAQNKSTELIQPRDIPRNKPF